MLRHNCQDLPQRTLGGWRVPEVEAGTKVGGLSGSRDGVSLRVRLRRLRNHSRGDGPDPPAPVGTDTYRPGSDPAEQRDLLPGLHHSSPRPGRLRAVRVLPVGNRQLVYQRIAPSSKNGRWDVKPTTTAPYKTRMVVYRPINPKDFDGTVVVEWLNVTAGIDAPAAWLNGHIQMIRPRDGLCRCGRPGRRDQRSSRAPSPPWTERVGSDSRTRLVTVRSTIPGDSYSYSIFQQAGEALRTSGPQILGGLHPNRVLALGESQSAFRLVTYIDALQTRSPGIFNGYFVYSRGGDASDLSQTPQTDHHHPDPDVHPHRHPRSGLPLRDRNRPAGTGLPGRPPTVDRVPARVGDGGNRPRRHLRTPLFPRSDTGNGVADTEAFESMLDPPSRAHTRASSTVALRSMPVRTPTSYGPL